MHRSELVRRATSHLQRRRPRLILSGILLASGLLGFAVSFGLLSAGIQSMAVRYGVAGFAGYVAFIGLLRLWAETNRVRRRDPEIDIDGPHLSDVLVETRGSSEEVVDVFMGGRSGGGGASGDWGPATNSLGHPC